MLLHHDCLRRYGMDIIICEFVIFNNKTEMASKSGLKSPSTQISLQLPFQYLIWIIYFLIYRLSIGIFGVESALSKSTYLKWSISCALLFQYRKYQSPGQQILQTKISISISYIIKCDGFVALLLLLIRKGSTIIIVYYTFISIEYIANYRKYHPPNSIAAMKKTASHQQHQQQQQENVVYHLWQFRAKSMRIDHDRSNNSCHHQNITISLYIELFLLPWS